MQTYIFYKAIDVGKIVFRAADIETGKWLDAPEFRRLERLLIFLRKNLTKFSRFPGSHPYSPKPSHAVRNDIIRGLVR